MTGEANSEAWVCHTTKQHSLHGDFTSPEFIIQGLVVQSLINVNWVNMNLDLNLIITIL